MYRLYCNGVLQQEGGDEVFDTFESRVERWNDETSGWDGSGNWLSLRFSQRWW